MLTKSELERLKGHIEYLLQNPISWDNREEFYDQFGHMLILLRNTDFNTFDLNHTYNKEIEFAVGAKDENDFESPFIQSFLPLVPDQIEIANEYVKEIENEREY